MIFQILGYSFIRPAEPDIHSLQPAKNALNLRKGIIMAEVDERLYKIIQKRFGYSEADIAAFKNSPRNVDILSRLNEFQNKLIILEVVESKGCNSGHKVGDKFYFDYAGNLLTDMCPKKVCGYSLNSALMMIFTANEMIFAGIDPNEIRFKRAACFDVGIECGGWGRIVLELKVEQKPQVSI